MGCVLGFGVCSDKVTAPFQGSAEGAPTGADLSWKNLEHCGHCSKNCGSQAAACPNCLSSDLEWGSRKKYLPDNVSPSLLRVTSPEMGSCLSLSLLKSFVWETSSWAKVFWFAIFNTPWWLSPSPVGIPKPLWGFWKCCIVPVRLPVFPELMGKSVSSRQKILLRFLY